MAGPERNQNYHI